MNRKNNMFREVPAPNVSRNLFDLSHEVKMSGKFSYLYPVLLMDCLPGDTIRDQMTAMVRFAPMLAPIMHRVDVTTHFFFVPCRLLTNLWEEFITGGQDGQSTPVLPYVTPSGLRANSGTAEMQKGSLWDYFGLPVLEAGTPAASNIEQISVLPFRAYLKIWSDYYRDPNFDTEADLDLDLAGDVSAQAMAGDYLELRERGWQKDYFTAALPWPQRGPEVLMPIEVSGDDLVNAFDGSPATADTVMGINPANPGNIGYGTVDLANGTITGFSSGRIVMQNTTVTINDLRTSLAIQRWMENNARGGGRYVEQIQSHFNQRVPDFRLQRAEYLGGGRQPVNISEVLSTADTATVPVGDMAGHGLSVGKSNRFTYRCQEHGFVIGIMSVMPQTAYQQGIDRMWSRTTKYDFGWPELANLGEQEILNKEVYFDFLSTAQADNQEMFGYIPRYSEYKFKQDRVAGDFRDNLAFWHLGRIFTQRPALDEQFTTMYENGQGSGGAPSSNEETYRRIFAVQDGTDYLWINLFHRLTAKRPLPYFGVPSIR